MVFPIMNLRTGINLRTAIKQPGFDEDDTIKKIKKIEKGLGDVMLMSDGKLKKGFNKNLITRIGEFNISRTDTDRFYWGRGNVSDAYFVNENGEVFLGHQLIKTKPLLEIWADWSITLEPAGHHSFAEMYSQSMFNLKGLYKKHKIKQTKGFFSPKENIDGKINFLENFLDLADESGFRPKEMVVKNPILRLKLLEQHYKNHADFYAMKNTNF